MTDKSQSKRIASAALGQSFIIIPTLWERERLPEAAPWPLPFVTKANHGCKHTAIVRKLADYCRARVMF